MSRRQDSWQGAAVKVAGIAARTELAEERIRQVSFFVVVGFIGIVIFAKWRQDKKKKEATT